MIQRFFTPSASVRFFSPSPYLYSFDILVPPFAELGVPGGCPQRRLPLRQWKDFPSSHAGTIPNYLLADFFDHLRWQLRSCISAGFLFAFWICHSFHSRSESSRYIALTN